MDKKKRQQFIRELTAAVEAHGYCVFVTAENPKETTLRLALDGLSGMIFLRQKQEGFTCHWYGAEKQLCDGPLFDSVNQYHRHKATTSRPTRELFCAAVGNICKAVANGTAFVGTPALPDIASSKQLLALAMERINACFDELLRLGVPECFLFCALRVAMRRTGAEPLVYCDVDDVWNQLSRAMEGVDTDPEYLDDLQPGDEDRLDPLTWAVFCAKLHKARPPSDWWAPLLENVSSDIFPDSTWEAAHEGVRILLRAAVDKMIAEEGKG